MGRVKSALIKKTAKQLLSENPEVFSKDFEANQDALCTTIANKKIKNILAGYITRLVKKRS